jgi:Spy/CpxP family protein refolding chaperone
LKMTAEQKKQWGEFEKELTAKVDRLLTAEQKEQLKKPPQGGAGGPMSFPQPGQIMSPTQQASLKLSAEQKKQLRDLQKEADNKLDSVFTADQKKQFKEMRANPGRAFGPGGGGPPGGIGNALFRAYRFAPDHSAVAGKDLKPGKLLEEFQETPKKSAAQ